MIRRLLGWFLTLLDLDGEREPKQSIACSIGWHRPGSIRSRGHFYGSDCVKPGCPVYIAARAALNA